MLYHIDPSLNPFLLFIGFFGQSGAQEAQRGPKEATWRGAFI